MSIDEIAEIISPLNNVRNSNDLSNPYPFIDKLNIDEKRQLENILINKLSVQTSRSSDILIIEVLSYLKSEKSLPILYEHLEYSNSSLTRLGIACSIYKIKKDIGMISIATEIMKLLDAKKDVYALVSAMKDLGEFKNNEVNDIIKRYINNPDPLVANNAKMALANGMK